MRVMLAMLFVLSLAVMGGGLISCTNLEYDAPAERGAIYSVYHVEMGIKEIEDKKLTIGYAMVNDPDVKYKVIYISNVCMETYRPNANILKVGQSNALHWPSCEWLVTQK